MPLFGNNNNTATTTAGGPGHNDTTGHHGHTGPGPAVGALAGGAAGHHEGHTTAGAALGAAAGHHHAKNHPAAGTVPPGVGNTTNAPGATTTVGGQTIPASGAHQGGNPATAGEKAFVGKLEHAAGTVLCSSTLKAKGIEKEREAQALKVQAAEIGAAERLEGEASARRERAVAHGAHPHNMHAGGGATGNTVGGGVGQNGPAGGAMNDNYAGGVGVGGAGGMGSGPNGAAGLR